MSELHNLNSAGAGYGNLRSSILAPTAEALPVRLSRIRVSPAPQERVAAASS